jgi:hypothetical protein
MSKRNRLWELKRIENKLKSFYNQDRFFIKLYESNNKDKIEDKEKINITSKNGRNIFSEIPKEIIDDLAKIGIIDSNIFNKKTNTLYIKTYKDILEAMQSLIYIMEYDLLTGIADGD